MEKGGGDGGREGEGGGREKGGGEGWRPAQTTEGVWPSSP